MIPTLSRSYAYCEALARREAGNFYHAFHVLPGPQRRSMCALYAFLRVTDDLADGDDTPERKRLLVDQWRLQFERALHKEFSHPLHPAFQHTVQTYRIPAKYLHGVLEGVAMDLAPVSYATFDELYRYCYHVASEVGLACIHIWGFRDDRALAPAVSAGIAFQLTNILRDLAEDAGRGRVYLPREDLDRFGYSSEQLRRGERSEAFHALMSFQSERARAYYAAATPLAAFLTPAGRAVFQVMLRTYRGLLDAIERRDFDVFSSRVRLSSWHKLGLAIQALPIRWGWA